MKQAKLSKKLAKVIWMQVLFISCTTVIGVYGAAFIVEDMLVRQALEGEAEHYWNLYKQDNNTPMPNTLNMRGYMDKPGNEEYIPPALLSTTESFSRVKLNNKEPIVHISKMDDTTLYLVFDEDQVSKLAALFGIAPLTVLLILIYITSWITFRLTHRAISPVIRLAKHVQGINLNSSDLSRIEFKADSDEIDQEVSILVQALDNFTDKLARAIERERNFTRDASHELRTPLAVIKGSVNILERCEIDDKHGKDSVIRIRNTVIEMESLIETLLMFAREQDIHSTLENVDITSVAETSIDAARKLLDDRPVEINLICQSKFQVRCVEKLLNIVISNLITNAINYTDEGKIDVIIEDQKITIKDTGIGMTKQAQLEVFNTFYRAEGNTRKGHGLGLAIVARICEQFAWEVHVESEADKGSAFSIHFDKGSST